MPTMQTKHGVDDDRARMRARQDWAETTRELFDATGGVLGHVSVDGALTIPAYQVVGLQH